MNGDSILERWHEWSGAMKARWGRITDDEWTAAAGDRERICGLLEQRYGLTREQAAAEFAASRGAAAANEIRPTAASDVEDHGVRAQPGDVLGLDTGGETTELGDTSEDEDKRRMAATRAARAASRD